MGVILRFTVHGLKKTTETAKFKVREAVFSLELKGQKLYLLRYLNISER